MIGVPQFMYARTPYASWGVTALYPDVMDLFVEDVEEESGTYFDAVTQKQEPFEILEETIRVRFGSDVKLRHKVTRNGVIMPLDLLDGSAGQVMPWIPQEVIKDIGPGKAYSIAWILDPIIQKNIGVEINTELTDIQISLGVEVKHTNFAQQR